MLNYTLMLTLDYPDVVKCMSNVSDDWSKGDTETWGESYFGDQKKGGCKGFVFTVSKAFVFFSYII